MKRSLPQDRSPGAMEPLGPDAARPGSERAGRRLAASSATVSIYNGLGVLAGFALDAAVAAAFGVGAQTDAFFSAWRLPYLTTTVVTMTAASILVPLFTRDLTAGAAGASSELFSRILNAVVLFMALVSVLGIVLSPWLVGGLFGGLPAESLALAISLSHILFLTVLFTGAVEVLRSYLYAHQIFGLPTAINFVRSVVTLAVLAAGLAIQAGAAVDDWQGLHILAWGYVAGVAAQLLVVGWQAYRRTAVHWLPLFDLRNPRLRQAARLSLAPTAGALVRQSINLAETAIASYLPPGSVTIISYANRITFVLSSVFLSSITTASTPVLSRDIAAERWPAVRQTVISALRLVAFLALPMGIGLAFLGVPVIRLLLERGRFTAEASQVTGAVLSLYALSILCLGYFRVVQAYFYAALKATLVLGLFAVNALVTIGLDIALAGVIGVRGIALGFSVGSLAATTLGLWLLARDGWGYRGQGDEAQREAGVTAAMVRSLIVLNVQVALASLAMTLAALGALRVLPATPWALLPALALGGLVFVATAWLLRVRELTLAWEMARRRR